MEDHSRPADEDVLDLPDSWRRRLYPRRGGRPGPKVKVDRSAEAAIHERVRELDAAGPLVDRDGVTPDMAEAMREYLSGAPNPLGAAVVAALLADDARYDHAIEKLAAPVADSWVIRHGVPFAACAFAELSQIQWVCPGLRPIEDRPSCSGKTVAATPMRKAGARLRGLLAAADDDVYEDAVERLARCRRSPSQRTVVSFLVPTRDDWLDECCAEPPDTQNETDFWRLLYCSLGPRHVDPLARYGVVHHYSWDRACLVTMADGAGAAIAPLLIRAFDADAEVTDVRKLILETLAVLPGDEAFQALVDRADQKYVRPVLLSAMKRFPVRAARLAASSPPAPAQDALPDAPADVLPPVLTDPPWTRTTKRAQPPVINGLTPPSEPSMRWEPGEREEWARTDERHHVPSTDDWDALAEEFRAGRAGGYDLGILTYGPEEKVRPLLAEWKPQLWVAEMWLRPTVARFGVDAFPVALRIAEEDPQGLGDHALPFLDADVARLMAHCLSRPKRGRKLALSWFERHGLDAVPLLVPAALGKPAVPRREAEEALRHLAARHGTENVIETTARAHGDNAAGAIKAMLTIDPLELLPSHIPPLSDWADVKLLPKIRLQGRDDALPADATGHFLTMLAISKPDATYAGVEVVQQICDPGSLAEFGWALFELWQQHGAPPKDAWAFTQLGQLGDDETARKLAPLIRAWPGDGGHAKAVTGLDVLTSIGSDIALLQLATIAQKVKFKGLKERAEEKIEEVATTLGLTSEQLGDRLVPDFGLDADAALVLDYGPRRFIIGFDEQLTPYVTDEGGTRRKSLPKPAVKDDPVLAPAAHAQFTALKKDVRTVAANQIQRLESAMVTRRRWTAEEFRRFFVEHPLIGHIARRLVWITEHDGATSAFRIAEDRTFADAADNTLPLPDPAAIGIVHPLDLGDLKTWSALFTDYAILQPFPQLNRTVHTLTETERAAPRLERFQDAIVPPEAILTLEHKGWRRSHPMDAGLQWCLYRELPGDLYVNINLDPGMHIGRPEDSGPQRLAEIRLDAQPETGHWSPQRTAHPFGALDPITLSELLADLAEASS
ncbi:hypothetical protein GCM10022254_23810 [Actinomadura meridiana]|uniref:DUF4132 domain-containing protein n=1 Tax=Actinomadura meridiana TaxID=559626 RepID=A0ABP8BXV9_9ACTN